MVWHDIRYAIFTIEHNTLNITISRSFKYKGNIIYQQEIITYYKANNT